MQEKVLEIIESIRVGLQADGGDLELAGINSENVVSLQLINACNGCPLSATTLPQAIRHYLKMQIPEITAVEIN